MLNLKAHSLNRKVKVKSLKLLIMGLVLRFAFSALRYLVLPRTKLLPWLILK
jgi:hypothetical protein